MSVYEAAAMAKSGKSADEIVDYLEKSAKKSSIYIIMGVLKYLRKGGRITPAAVALAIC